MRKRSRREGEFKESNAVFQPDQSSAATAINRDTLRQIVDGLTRVPEGFNILPKIKRMLIDRRRTVFEAGGPYDWGFAEALAFGSLLLENMPVRLSGQDSRRGTFGQRHAVIYDAKTGRPYIPLLHLAEKQARICIYNSLLSEAAVLGFDYGYSLDYPNMLCLWEAQFGDFANGAQTIIDSLGSRAESNWQRPSGMYCSPHGYEGQGPERPAGGSSGSCKHARMTTSRSVNLTTPAIFTRPPAQIIAISSSRSSLDAKSLSAQASGIAEEDFTEGSFSKDWAAGNASSDKIDRVNFCSGKVYYDLLNPAKRPKS